MILCSKEEIASATVCHPYFSLTHRAVPTWTALIRDSAAAGAVADAEVRTPAVDLGRGVWVRK